MDSSHSSTETQAGRGAHLWVLISNSWELRPLCPLPVQKRWRVQSQDSLEPSCGCLWAHCTSCSEQQSDFCPLSPRSGTWLSIQWRCLPHYRTQDLGYEDNFQKNVISQLPSISTSHKVVEGQTHSGEVRKWVAVDVTGIVMSLRGDGWMSSTWWAHLLRGTNKPRECMLLLLLLLGPSQMHQD